MKKETDGKRESGIELLRIFLIFFIIVHHLMLYGTGFFKIMESNSLINSQALIMILINSFAVIGVNCFIFISGFYGIKQNMKSIIKLILQAVFYSASIVIIFGLLNIKSISIKEYINSFIPLRTWWFFTTYVVLYVFSPYINKMIDNLNVREQIRLVISATILICIIGNAREISNLGINNGYSIINFVYIYIIGRVFSKNYKNKINKYIYLLGYIFTTIVLFLVAVIFWNLFGSGSLIKLFGYNNPLLIISSIFIFYFFYELKFYSKIINYVSVTTFGVYLLHGHPCIDDYLYKRDLIFESFTTNTYTYIFVTAIIVLCMCVVIDKIREIIFKPILEFIFNKIIKNKF